MLTYQLQPRRYKLVNSESMNFPSNLVLEVKYAPGTSFGTDDGLSRCAVKSRKGHMAYNANTGRGLFQSEPPLKSLDVTIVSDDNKYKFVLKGDTLQYHCICETERDLDAIIRAFHYIFPTLLNLSMPDPPIVEYVKGKLGEVDFHWEHLESRVNFLVVDEEVLEKGVIDSFENMGLFVGLNNRRLAAALHYSHKASRLIVAGQSDWEFMSEAILNYCKAMEMLFVESEDSRDDTRKGLQALGYTDLEIESDFIPLYILRGFVDVAHAKVAIHKQDQLRIIYLYLSDTENRFRKLLTDVIAQVKSGTFTIPVVNDSSLDSKDRSGMDKLIDSLRERIITKK